jgi:hypothetical protein
MVQAASPLDSGVRGPDTNLGLLLEAFASNRLSPFKKNGGSPLRNLIAA